MRKFHSITALCGDALRPELQALFKRLAVDPQSELFVRDDGMIQAGPNPASETASSNEGAGENRARQRDHTDRHRKGQ
jgi:hypothetical protein